MSPSNPLNPTTPNPTRVLLAAGAAFLVFLGATGCGARVAGLEPARSEVALIIEEDAEGHRSVVHHGRVGSDEERARLDALCLWLEAELGPAMVRSIDLSFSESGRSALLVGRRSNRAILWPDWSRLDEGFVLESEEPHYRRFDAQFVGERWVDLRGPSWRELVDVRALDRRIELPEWVRSISIGSDDRLVVLSEDGSVREGMLGPDGDLLLEPPLELDGPATTMHAPPSAGWMVLGFDEGWTVFDRATLTPRIHGEGELGATQLRWRHGFLATDRSRLAFDHSEAVWVGERPGVGGEPPVLEVQRIALPVDDEYKAVSPSGNHALIDRGNVVTLAEVAGIRPTAGAPDPAIGRLTWSPYSIRGEPDPPVLLGWYVRTDEQPPTAIEAAAPVDG